MGLILTFSLKGAIVLTMVFSVYMVAMSHLKGDVLRRWALLATCLAALTLPFFNFRIPHATPPLPHLPSGSKGTDIAVVSQFNSDTPLVYKIIAGIVLAGMVALLLHTIYSIVQIYRLRIRGRRIIRKGVSLIIVPDNDISLFCFGKMIFVSERDYATMPDMVFIHERSHVTNRHSLDLMLARVILILQWWNPFAWLLFRELHTVHEFQADRSVLDEGIERIAYQRMLLTRASGAKGFYLGNGLGKTRLRQRLKMMNRTDSCRTIYPAASLLLVGIIGAVFLLSSSFMASVIACASEIRFGTDHTIITLKEYGRYGCHTSSSSGESVILINGQSLREEPAIMINGQLVANEYLTAIDPHRIKSITVHKDKPEYPDGLIDIRLKENVEFYESFFRNHTEKKLR